MAAIYVFTGHHLLLLALSGFYERRKTDPFVGGLIEAAKEQIAKAEEVLDRETEFSEIMRVRSTSHNMSAGSQKNKGTKGGNRNGRDTK